MTRSYEDFSLYGKDFAESSAQSLASLSSHAQVIATEATEYTRKSIQANGEFVEAVLSAPSFEDMVDLQTDYLKRSYEGFVAQATRTSELYANLARDAYRPFESLGVTAG